MAYEKYYKNFKKYELTRRGGFYNMITQATEAAKDAKLTLQNYSEIVRKYSFIKSEIEEKFGSVDNFLKETK